MKSYAAPIQVAKKPFYKKPLVLAVIVLLAILLTVSIAALTHYLLVNRERVEFSEAQLSDSGDTLIINSARFKGSFWNFIKSDWDKKNPYILGSSKDYILSRDGSVWQLEQEISISSPLADIDPENQEYMQARLMDGNFGVWVLAYPGGGSHELITLQKNGNSSWTVQQNLSETIPELAGYTGLFLREVEYSAELNMLIIRQSSDDNREAIFYILKFNGSVWKLDRTVNEDEFISDVDEGIWDIRLDGDTLVALTIGQDENPALHILRWDGVDWQLEQEVSTGQPFGGLSLIGQLYGMRFEEDTILLALSEDGFDRFYILRRNDSTWVLEREISKNEIVEGMDLDFGSNCRVKVDLDRDTLLLQERRTSYILRRRDSTWVLEQEISKEQLTKGINFDGSEYSGLLGGPCPESWDIYDLNGDTLILGNDYEGLLYILERNGSDWELKQKIEGEF